nr:hypothetical protein [uncultured Shinella sp.]
MTTSTSSNGVRWLGLLASPTFAVMMSVSMFDEPQAPICGEGSGLAPFSSMTVMYLLMALFHLAPWFKLAGRPSAQGE